MLQITIPDTEAWNDRTQEFTTIKGVTLQLEHSLLSISKWEAKWHKAFISEKDKSIEETIDYVRCMTLTKNVDAEVYSRLTQENMNKISEYINESMTATVINESRMSEGPKDVITSDLIYYWMVALNIPFECQKWHLNRLITLIKVCSLKSQSPKKISRNEIMSRNKALNEARKKQHHTKG